MGALIAFLNKESAPLRCRLSIERKKILFAGLGSSNFFEQDIVYISNIGLCMNYMLGFNQCYPKVSIVKHKYI